MTRLVAVLMFCVLWPTTPTAVQSSDPLTMGRLVHLQASNQLSIATLGSALRDPDAGIRAVAARIVGVSKVTSQQSNLINAFATETDEYAKHQMAVSLVVFGTPETIAAVEGHLGRLTPSGVLTYARWLGRRDPDRFIERIPDLAALLGARSGELARVALLAAAAHPEKRDALLRPLMGPQANKGWNIIVSAALSRRGSKEDLALVTDALSAADAATRSQTVWTIVRELDGREPPPTKLLEAAARDAAPEGDPLSWERFGREVIVRRLTRKTVPDRSAFIAVEAGAHAEEAQPLLVSKDLRPPEQSALRTALEITSGDRARPSALRIETVRPMSKIRLATVPSPGFMSSLFAATGCVPPARPVFGVVAMTFDTDRRPIRVKTETSDVLSSECTSALADLRHVTLADDAEIPDIKTGQWIILPVTAGYVACTNDRFDLSVPDAHLAPRVDSFVVSIEATIGRSGCVREASVVGSVTHSVDFDAIRRVSQWPYPPPRVHNEPAEVRLRVTVGFLRN
jgi:hypothetical protein